VPQKTKIGRFSAALEANASMKLGQILEGMGSAGPTGSALQFSPALEVGGLAYDSRRVAPGFLFFAIQGGNADGHRFIEPALKTGAIGVVSEREAPADFARVWVKVPHIRRALSGAARAFAGHPELKLRLVGITGTNGKTTTAFLIHSILEAAGETAGLFGTIEYRFGAKRLTATNTTPESLDLVNYLSELVDSGGSSAVMEASSHALAQERIWGLPFAAAVFMNLTGDHLDYHHTMENYFAAKRRLFEGLGTPPPAAAVINLDDPWSAKLLELKLPHILTFGSHPNAIVRLRSANETPEGVSLTLQMPSGKLQLESRLIGRGNRENLIAAASAAEGLGVSHEAIRKGIAAMSQVPGRFERVDEGQPFLVIVDYAHTHDALRNALLTARELTRQRLIVVFGCGGDRDRSKRPLMGEAAGALSDLAVITSDNPRNEDPVSIMNDAMVGLQKSGKRYLAEVDRRAAIRTAIEQARTGDVVLIAGKGHETYQVLKDRTIAFDDREVARQALQEFGWNRQAGQGR
jgi:UDP-N-acetylmuramoyl-L-alanyl-D-glutamate--2,6-diaminopimelate ligase